MLLPSCGDCSRLCHSFPCTCTLPTILKRRHILTLTFRLSLSTKACVGGYAYCPSDEIALSLRDTKLSSDSEPATEKKEPTAILIALTDMEAARINRGTARKMVHSVTN